MRQLTKGAKPLILETNEITWTAEYLNAVPSGTQDKHEHWRHKDIKAALHEETSGRCAYCEVDIGDVTWPHVEHIQPKSAFPELAHVWHNLACACPRCNGNKKEYYHPDYAILNPFVDQISDHIDFPGGFVSAKLGAKRGEITIKKLKLNHNDLVRARAERLSKIEELVNRWNESSDPLRTILADAIRLDAMEGEFSAAVAQHLRHLDFPVDSSDET